MPLLAARVLYRGLWRHAALVMVSTMAVDLDHLRASPIYDPLRCSIGFHPLHTTPAILFYVGLFALPLVLGPKAESPGVRRFAFTMHLIGLGLLIHMMLDWGDCWYHTL